MYIFIDKYLGGSRSALALIRTFVEVDCRDSWSS